MMRLIFIIVLLSLRVGCSGEQPALLRLHYESTESPSTELKIKLSGVLQDKKYRIRMVHFKEGKVTYKILSEEPFMVADTMLFIHINAEPLHAHEVRFTLEGEDRITEKVEIDDVLHSILMEVYPNHPYNSTDTIPLAGYTSGAPREVMIDGVLAQGGSYCDVRNAKLAPTKWGETFKMKEYLWFDLYFE